MAPTDANVLLLGETGTGKDLIAHAIHNLSPRCERPFVKLDCAAIPFDLLESELFGFEAGAFSWGQNIDRFQMADTGTLFLDEIGDLPLALQPKLLRILQEQECERTASGRGHHVNVRLLAATNRDLMEMVRQGEFRSDLYYRLNGFPIMLPPLRERRQDIALLVSHFVEMFSKRIGKRILHIPEETLSAFTAHSWPGNVRELQNLIERAVILSNGGVLPNPLPISDRKSMASISSPGMFNSSRKGAIRSNGGALPSPLPVRGRNSITANSARGALKGAQRAAMRSNYGAGPDHFYISQEDSVGTADLSSQELESFDASPDLPRVFVVDGDVSVRESMDMLIRHVGWQSVTFSSAQEFLDWPRLLVPNCLVIDVSLQYLDGVDLQKRFAVERAETPIIFIAGKSDVPTSVQAMKAGAVEFLIKPLSDEALLKAIREALTRSAIALGREAEMRSVRDCYGSLSHRERQVMALVLSGLLNKQVGAELGISEITVKAHRGRVMRKMGAKSVVDLVRIASRLRSGRAFVVSGASRSLSASPTIATSPGPR